MSNIQGAVNKLDFSKSAEENTLRLFILTDCHLGVNENDPVTNNDSFRTFEEALKIAKDCHVDCIIFGGDLFHLNKPSHQTLFKTIQILRKYCLGNNELKFQIVSDQKLNFPVNSSVNYKDPNFNISLPFFAIHGNHDDPSGLDGLSALDVLAATNLINYFGKVEKVNQINLNPILFKKGNTRVALYGLGHIRDERLHRTFSQSHIDFIRKQDDKESWFNILVLHQNRVKHSSYYKNSIVETMLPSFLDLVYWAHEHECLIELQESESGNFFITQPGSTVLTSLSPGEAKQKHVGILEIRGESCRLQPIPLRTVRPFIIEDISLAHHFDVADEGIKTRDNIEQFLLKKVEELILKTSIDFSHNKDMKPLLRLRVDYSGEFPLINTQSFGANFVEKVANASEILHFFRKRAVLQKKESLLNDGGEIMEVGNEDDSLGIMKLIRQYLPHLKILRRKNLDEAISSFADKNEIHAIEHFVKTELKTIQTDLYQQNIKTKNEILSAIEVRSSELAAENNINNNNNDQLVSNPNPDIFNHDNDSNVNSDIDIVEHRSSTSRGRGRGIKIRSRQSTTRPKTKHKRKDNFHNSSDNDEEWQPNIGRSKIKLRMPIKQVIQQIPHITESIDSNEDEQLLPPSQKKQRISHSKYISGHTARLNLVGDSE